MDRGQEEESPDASLAGGMQEMGMARRDLSTVGGEDFSGGCHEF